MGAVNAERLTDGVCVGAVIADREARYLSLIGDGPRLLDEMVSRMCGGVADGYQGLPEICRDWDVPYGKVLGWLMADAGRYEVYQRALEMQAKGLVSEALPLADDTKTDKGSLTKAKLQIETRFRLAKYHDSRVYGDKVDVNHNVTPVFSVTINSGKQDMVEIDVSDDERVL